MCLSAVASLFTTVREQHPRPQYKGAAVQTQGRVRAARRQCCEPLCRVPAGRLGSALAQAQCHRALRGPAEQLRCAVCETALRPPASVLTDVVAKLANKTELVSSVVSSNPAASLPFNVPLRRGQVLGVPAPGQWINRILSLSWAGTRRTFSWST